MTLHSDWLVRLSSGFVFLFFAAILSASLLVVEQGRWLVLLMLTVVLFAGWKWTRRHLFRHASGGADGIRWSAT